MVARRLDIITVWGLQERYIVGTLGPSCGLPSGYCSDGKTSCQWVSYRGGDDQG